MTQGQLAGADFSKGFISLVETGRTRMSLRAAGILAGRLGVSLSVLLAEEGAGGETGVEAALASAIKRTKELEVYALKTRTELELALAAVRRLVDSAPTTPRRYS